MAILMLTNSGNVPPPHLESLTTCPAKANAFMSQLTCLSKSTTHLGIPTQGLEKSQGSESHAG